MNLKRLVKPFLVIIMALLTLTGASPIRLFAQDSPDPYMYMDGERIGLDDERIESFMFITPFAGGNGPPVETLTSLSGDFSRSPDVTMDSKNVSTKRYSVLIEGIQYEAYCANPNLKGPDSAGSAYALLGEGNAQLINALKNGYPINTEWSDVNVDTDDRMFWVYVTRVAVAMANNPSHTFAGDSDIIDQAQLLANGSLEADADMFPPIAVNNEKDAEDSGRVINTATAKSQAFTISYNRKTGIMYHPFQFEWGAGTPAGAKLVVDGNVVATAPTNPDTVFRDNITSFQIEMPNTTEFEGETAAVNLVGIHNQYADKVWVMENSVDPEDWQLIAFYIPEVTASAAFSFTSDEEIIPDPEPDPIPASPGSVPTSVRIQKIDALTRENIPGALIRLRGISSSQVITEDGQIREIDNTGINLSQVLTAGATVSSGDVQSTVTDGVWTLEGLPYGAYVAEEERAPQNYSLLPQHTSYSFWLLPGNVTIKLNQDESTVYVDDVQESIHEALSAAIAGIQNYDDAEGLATELQNILDNLLSQLQVDAVFTVEVDQSTNSQLLTFENYPFGQIEVMKYDMVTELPLADAHFRIQGYFPEGNTNGMPIDRVGVTGPGGQLIFEDLPAGHYTITEIEAPGGYELDYNEYRAISLTWGQTASTSFYNKPKTFVEVIKVDGDDTGILLDGAVFRLTDPLTGETWEGTTVGGKVRLGEGEGSYGNQLGAETVYILTEIQAPPGYVLDPSPREVILAANNQLNVVTVPNFKKPTLTLIKLDELTNKPLADASFKLWKTEGETWSETQVTDANGVITWTDLDPGLYSLQEVDEPYGYFQDPTRKEILLKGGDNKQLTFFNRPRPVLTILKRDKVTGASLPGVLFRVQRLEGETIGEFLTDANGMIELSPRTGYLLDEKIYRVTEVQPPVHYLLDSNPVKEVQLKWYDPTELVYENLLKPTLIFIKRNAMSGRGISDATYHVAYEDAYGGVVNLGTYKTKCGLIVLPYVQPGWYILTETIAAPGYGLPSNPVQRMYLAQGENSYTYDQTHTELYVDPRTNPSSGDMGDCGDWCGYLCSSLCAGNCGNPGCMGEQDAERPTSPGGGNMAGGSGGLFGNIVITNGNGEPLGTVTTPPASQPVTIPPTEEPPTEEPPVEEPPAEDPPPDFSGITITGGTIIYLNPLFANIVITFGY